MTASSVLIKLHLIVFLNEEGVRMDKGGIRGVSFENPYRFGKFIRYQIVVDIIRLKYT